VTEVMRCLLTIESQTNLSMPMRQTSLKAAIGEINGRLVAHRANITRWVVSPSTLCVVRRMMMEGLRLGSKTEALAASVCIQDMLANCTTRMSTDELQPVSGGPLCCGQLFTTLKYTSSLLKI